ncbi:MAG: hypothetical protein ACOYZ8_06905 [Chloroflexota bacterium]
MSARKTSKFWSNLDQGWQPLLALFAVDMMELILSDTLTVKQILPKTSALESDPLNSSVTLILFVTVLFAWLLGSNIVKRISAIIYAGWVTLGLISSLVVLILTMPARTAAGAGIGMLWDALMVWGVNVVIFAVWYWLIDSGGHEARSKSLPERRDFVFPQQANASLSGWDHWTPGFVDYMFLAFNTSTAFSPTDTLILTYKAKLATMLQATISLITIAALAGYAINIMAG